MTPTRGGAPHPGPPVVQRLRVRYAKRGRLRFTSHRDFQRALERAVRRAGLPVAYSQGFSPHPRISYANAAPTGAASEAEYVEIGLAEPRAADVVRDALDAALPPGLDLVDVVEARTPAFAERLEAGEWRIVLPRVDPAVAADACQRFLGAGEVGVTRLTKDGERTLDARASVVSLDVDLAPDGRPAAAPAGQDADRDRDRDRVGEEPCAILRLVVRHGSPSVRPDDVLAGLRQVAALELPVPPQVTRLAQGPLHASGTVGDPLAPDREARSDGAAAAVEPGTPTDA